MCTIRRFGIWALLWATPAVFAQGVIVTIAGSDRVFPSPVAALSAPIDKPDCAAFDSSGNLYICDYGNNLVIKIDLNGTATVVAGNGIRAGGFSGDGGPATSASLKRPIGVAFDQAGNMYIADFLNSRIRKVDPQGIITTFAGTGASGNSGDGGLATLARLNSPSAVVFDNAGNLYFSDNGARVVRKIDTRGIITTVAGTGAIGSTGDGGLATAAALGGPSDLTIDSTGNLYVAEISYNVIRKFMPGGTISVVAGNRAGGFSGDGGSATLASIRAPEGVAVDGQGNVYIADAGNNRIRRITAGVISTVAGGGGLLGDGGPAIGANVASPMDVAVDAAGALFIPDLGNRRLRRVSAGGTISTIAGNGQPHYSGDGGAATQAELDEPRQMALDSAGNLFFADVGNHVIRKISLDGKISTVAGTGRSGLSGDGGPATSATLNRPHSVAVGADGSLYIADFSNARVRKVSNGTITNIAGGGNLVGDNGPATAALVNGPSGVQVDAAGNVFFSEYGGNRIRKVTPAGVITTVAGNGVSASSGDGGAATSASVNGPSGVALDAAGNMYITECTGNRIRKISQGIITTFAGNGQGGGIGDGGPATLATMGCPEGPAVDASGNLYFAANNRVRKINFQGIISTVAGIDRAGFSGDGGLAPAALLNGPWGVAVDSTGNLYIGDHNNNRIRKVLSTRPAFSAAPVTLSFSAPAGSAPPASQLITVSSNLPSLLWETSRVLGPPNGWLTVSPNSGPTPGTLTVTASPLNLPAGTYQGTIELTAAGGAPPIVISVTFTVTASRPAQLAVDPLRLGFRTLAGAAAPPALALRIENAGSGTLNWTARAAGTWLTISPASGIASPGAPSSLQVTVNPTGLAVGSYSGSITVEGGNQSITVPVSLLVQENTGALLLSPSHMLFRAIQDGGVEPSQTFGVLNIGAGAIDWTATTRDSWLRLTPASGSSTAGATQIPFVTVSVDPTGLRTGTYAGQIRVTAAGANNAPQVLRVDLHVIPPTGRLGAVVRPTGLIFVGSASSSPGAQTVSLSTTESSPLEFVSQPIDGPWVTRAPDLSTASRNSPGSIVVQPNLEGLAPGVYRAGLTVFTRNDGEQHPVRLLLVVLPAGTVQTFAGGPAADCTPTQLLLQFSTLFANFNGTAGWPSSVIVNARDDCGNPAVGGAVFLSFSNGDSTVALNELPNGQYQGNWRPTIATSSQVVLTARGLWKGLRGEISAAAQVGLNPDPGLAALNQGGVVLGAGFAGGPLAPGSIVSLFGQRLATGENSAASLPLPRTLGGLKVLIGNQEAPLFYVGPGQVNAQVPVELAADRQIQVLVETNGIQSAPEPAQTAGTRPGIFTTTGSQGAILIANTPLLASPANPAQVGGFISIYCTGLGATNPPVASGERPPDSPPATVRTPVAATVGGQAATVTFAGLAPGFAGVYQVNVQIPTSVTPGDAVSVVLTQGGFASNVATIAVR